MSKNILKKQISKYSILGIIFVSIVGSLGHFIYDWTGQNKILGLFFAINESTWEHMKLLYFPMILYALIIYMKIPSVLPAFFLSSLSGIFLIPVLFYTYTGILGFMITPLNLAVFYTSVIITFAVFCFIAKRYKFSNYRNVIYYLVIIYICIFFLFTYSPPDLAIFKTPDI